MSLEERIKLLLKKLTYLHGNRINKVAKLIIEEVRKEEDED